jgi:type I restriction enzyme S subunit
MSWPLVTLDSLKANVPYACVGGPFGSNLTSKHYVDDGVPVIRGHNLGGAGWFDEDGFVFVTPDKADQLRSNLAFRGDLLFTQRGTLGQVGLIPEDSRYDRYVVSQSQMKLTVDTTRVDARFVYQYFRLPSTVEGILNRTITAGVPHINLGILKGLEVPCPPLRVQQGIAEFAQTYDDLIATNQRRIALLEDAARRLYREWFVHLRFPGHESVPVKSGVPRGWQPGTLDQAMFLQRGFDLPNGERVPGEVPVYASTGINGFHNQANAAGPGVVTGRSGTLGVVHYVPQDYWPLNTSLWVKEFRAVSPLLAYFILSELHLEQFNAGASVPTLDRKVVHQLPIVVPAPGVVADFDAAVQPLFDQIHVLKASNATTARARDLLLPQLMSGQLDVSRIPLPDEVAA